jgi:putative transposase
LSVTGLYYRRWVSRCRSFKYLLSPTVRQRVGLVGLLSLQCELYNAALEERRGAWRWEHRSVSYVDQCRTLASLRGVRPEILASGVTVCRGTLRRLDLAFAAFYRRCAAGQRPGYPRFRSQTGWDSIQWEDRNGWRLDPTAKRLHLMGIGAVKMRLHRPLRGTPKAITVRREGRRWWVTIRCADVPAEPLPSTGRHVGIDLGVTVLVATSEGTLITNDRHAQRAANRLARAQQDLASKQRGSQHRHRAVEHVALAHRRVRNRRADTLHQLSRRLVNDYDLIVHEQLAVANLVRRPKPRPDGAGGFAPNGAAAKTGLNRSIHDAGWGQLLAMISYKAESAGRTVIAVNPRNTSRTCAHCGHVSVGNRRGAVFECQACGHQAHADTNAAINILRAGRAQQPRAA